MFRSTTCRSPTSCIPAASRSRPTPWPPSTRLAEAASEALFAAVAQPLVDELPSIEPEAISRELGLSGSMPSAELGAKRRAFAFKNHPDRVAPHLRQRAMVRMQVANMLIDEAKKAARRSR